MTVLKIILLGVCLSLAQTPALAHPSASGRLAKVDHEIQHATKNQDLYIKRALLFIETRNIEAARQDLETAGNLGRPEKTAFAQALLLRKEGLNKRAIKLISAHIARHRQDYVALEIRAELHAERQDYSPAIRDYKRLIANMPQPSPGHYLILADCLIKYSADYQAALAVLDQGLIRLKATSQLQRQAIKYELQQQNYSAALKRHEDFKIILGHTPEWLRDKASILERSGALQQAYDVYQQAQQQLLDNPVLNRKIKVRRQLKTELRKKLAMLGTQLAYQY